MTDTKIENLTETDQELYKTAVQARQNAYIPYSHFAVGAAVRCANGKVYVGCNIENASYGLCCCGERNAMFAAACAGEREMDTIVVVADTTGPVSPCGACRQVMSEFHLKKIILSNLKGDAKICTLEDLLPYGFEL